MRTPRYSDATVKEAQELLEAIAGEPTVLQPETDEAASLVKLQGEAATEHEGEHPIVACSLRHADATPVLLDKRAALRAVEELRGRVLSLHGFLDVLRSDHGLPRSVANAVSSWFCARNRHATPPQWWQSSHSTPAQAERKSGVMGGSRGVTVVRVEPMMGPAGAMEFRVAMDLPCDSVVRSRKREPDVSLTVQLKREVGAGKPAPVATVAVTSLVNELVVLSFAYYDPLLARAGPDGQLKVDAEVFSQIALPRSTCAHWLEQTLTMVKGLNDRDTLGWDRVVSLVTDTGEKP